MTLIFLEIKQVIKCWIEKALRVLSRKDMGKKSLHIIVNVYTMKQTIFPEKHSRSPAAAAAAKSCLSLCDPIDGSPQGSHIPGILQARTLEWVGISFSNAWKWKVKVKSLSRVRLFMTPWTAAHQAPLSLGFSRQEYWSWVPFPFPIHACMLSRFSRVQLSATLWTATHKAPLATGFSRQEYWSGLPFPSPADHLQSHKNHIDIKLLNSIIGNRSNILKERHLEYQTSTTKSTII